MKELNQVEIGLVSGGFAVENRKTGQNWNDHTKLTFGELTELAKDGAKFGIMYGFEWEHRNQFSNVLKTIRATI